MKRFESCFNFFFQDMLQQGDSLVLRDAGGFCRVVNKLDAKQSYRVGRINIPGSELINRRYGETLIKVGESWSRCQPTVIEQSTEECEGATPEEVEIEQEDAEQSKSTRAAMLSDTFAAKSVFSQEKYLLKKHKKYASEVTLLEPTIMNLSEVVGSPIRWDAIALILRYGNATAGSKVLVWDDAVGLTTAALLQRGCHVTRITAGKGTNSAKGIMDLAVSRDLLKEVRLTDLEVVDHFDSLVIVNTENQDVTLDDIIEKSLEAVSTSCGIVTVYTRHFEAASELHKRFRLAKEYLNVTMTETFFREHQIMDQRTHPLMQSEVNLCQGFIVTCMKVKE
jgi:hypothetical protein